MGFKKLILILVAIYLFTGIFIAYVTPLYEDVSNFEIILKAPIYLWDMAKTFITNI